MEEEEVRDTQREVESVCFLSPREEEEEEEEEEERYTLVVFSHTHNTHTTHRERERKREIRDIGGGRCFIYKLYFFPSPRSERKTDISDAAEEREIIVDERVVGEY